MTLDLFIDGASINLFVDNIVNILDEVVRSFKFRLFIFNKFNDFLTLNLYSISIDIKCVELYLVELFNIAISYESIIDYSSLDTIRIK